MNLRPVYLESTSLGPLPKSQIRVCAEAMRLTTVSQLERHIPRNAALPASIASRFIEANRT